MRTMMMTASMSLLLVACAPESEAPNLQPETPPASVQEVEAPVPESELTTAGTVVEQKRATIDWASAREDYAARDTDENDMAVVASGGAPAVPVLLPDEPVGVASAGDGGLQFRPMADGYFAVKEGELYDLIINGTDRLVVRPGDQGAATDTGLQFEETLEGAQVSFSRYGASYLVEFLCKDPATAAKGSCVSEAEALEEVEKLLIAGTR